MYEYICNTRKLNTNSIAGLGLGSIPFGPVHIFILRMRCNPTSATNKNENEYCLMRSWLNVPRGLGWALKSKLLCGRSCWARPLMPISEF